MLASPAKLPTREDIKKLTVTDIAIMNELAYFLRDSLKKYISIDPFTALDPFGNEDDYTYSIIVDIEEPIRIIAMVATKKDPLPQNLEQHTDGRLIRLSLSRLDAAGLKYEMMPKGH